MKLLSMPIATFFPKVVGEQIDDTLFRQCPVKIRSCKHAIIAGGALRDSIMGKEKCTDFDFYSPQDQALKVIETNTFLQNSLWSKCPTSNLYRTVWEATPRYIYPWVKVDLIFGKKIKSVGELLDGFDFTINQFAMDNKKVYYTDSAMRDLLARRLVVVSRQNKMNLLGRVCRFSREGFSIDKENLDIIRDIIKNEKTKKEY